MLDDGVRETGAKLQVIDLATAAGGGGGEATGAGDLKLTRGLRSRPSRRCRCSPAIGVVGKPGMVRISPQMG